MSDSGGHRGSPSLIIDWTCASEDHAWTRINLAPIIFNRFGTHTLGPLQRVHRCTRCNQTARRLNTQ